MSDQYKTGAGRLREAGAQRILAMRKEVNPTTQRIYTYQEIALSMGVSLGTVYNVVKKRTWSFLEGAP